MQTAIATVSLPGTLENYYRSGNAVRSLRGAYRPATRGKYPLRPHDLEEEAARLRPRI